MGCYHVISPASGRFAIMTTAPVFCESLIIGQVSGRGSDSLSLALTCLYNSLSKPRLERWPNSEQEPLTLLLCPTLAAELRAVRPYRPAKPPVPSYSVREVHEACFFSRGSLGQYYILDYKDVALARGKDLIWY